MGLLSMLDCLEDFQLGGKNHAISPGYMRIDTITRRHRKAPRGVFQRSLSPIAGSEDQKPCSAVKHEFSQMEFPDDEAADNSEASAGSLSCESIRRILSSLAYDGCHRLADSGHGRGCKIPHILHIIFGGILRWWTNERTKLHR